MNAKLVGIFALLVTMLLPAVAHATGSVVISQIQTGDTLALTNEAVELYNNSSVDYDITNWCIQYLSASSSSSTPSQKYCFTSADEQTRIYLSGQSYATFASTGYVMLDNVSPDGRFSGTGLAAGGGHIRLIDELLQPQDVVGWGTAQFGEGYIESINLAPPAPNVTQALHRKVLTPSVLQDTQDNRADFELKTPAMRTGGIYELRIAVDMCGNLSDIQEVLPTEYGYDEAGNCELLSVDVCTNLELVQLDVPLGLLRAEDGSCHVDVCENLVGLQNAAPSGYRVVGNECTELERRAVLFNEILPNVSGSDMGFEFIELYNPNSEAINLSGYQLQVGKSLEKTIVFDDIIIAKHSYFALYDSDYSFTLLNTSSNLRLVAPAGNTVSELSYTEPMDDQSWANIAGKWSYTNQPTPGLDNLPMSVEVDNTKTLVSSPAPCPTGKYRHPITNRCRNIESDTSMLVACDSDEYRNPETNRCRKIASLTSVLVPCAEGSERNLETNRCRKVAAATTSLTPCQVGYERNLDTNRCRKIIASSATSAEVQARSETGSDTLKNVLVATAGVGALSYGLYEWRSELLRGIRRLLQLVSGK